MDKFKSHNKKSSSNDLNDSSDSMISNNKEGENSYSSNIMNIPNENDINNNNKNNSDKPCFCFIIKDTKKIMLYNILDKTSEIKEFNFFEFKLNGTMSVQYKESNNKIFLSGGLYYEDSLFSRTKIYSDTLYIFEFSNEPKNENIENKEEFIKIKMPRIRYNHSSLLIGSKIYFVGGKDAKGNYIFECDCYNTKEKIWELLPKLNYGREFPSIFCYHKKFLYTFRSLEKEANSFVEILNINDLNEGWRKIQIQDPINSFIPAIKSGIAQFNDNTLIICGGYLINEEPQESSFLSWNNLIGNSDNSSQNKKYGNKKKEISDYCYLFNIVTNTLYRTKNLEKPASFTYNGFYIEDPCKIIFIDEKNMTNKPFGLHVFEMNNKKWSFS